MTPSVEFPIEAVVISIFIGYMYYYMVDRDDVLSWTSIILGCISGFVLSTFGVLYGLVTANAFTFQEFVESSLIIGVQSMVVAIVLVIIGGYLAITIKQFLINLKR